MLICSKYKMPKFKEYANDHEKDVPEIKNDQPENSYTQLQIFQSHTDIVRLLVKIDAARFASAADDCLVIVWDVETNQRVHILCGHSRPVSCLSVLDTQQQLSEVILLTGASDKLICIWGVETGILLHTVTNHQGPVRCLASLNKKRVFCAAGEKLSVWNHDGKLLTKLNRTEEEDIQHVIILGENIIVTAADKDLSVFRYVEREQFDRTIKQCLQMMAKLQKHPDSMRCLTFISDTSFASGSIDGTIVVWSYQQGAWHQLWEYVDPKAEDKTFSTSIQAMLPLAEKCLVVAVGRGFAVFDVVTGKLLTDRRNAHKLKILHMEFIKERAMLLTCSEDGAIRLWGRELEGGDVRWSKSWDQAIDHFLNLTSNLKSSQPELIGECLGHTGPIHMMIEFGRVGFISCGVDMLVLAWKDGELEEMKRREIIANCLAECPASVV